MASGRKRGFPAHKGSERERGPGVGDGEKARARERETRERRRGGRGGATGRQSSRVGSVHGDREGRGAGPSAAVTKKNLASGVGALQLESTTGRGDSGRGKRATREPKEQLKRSERRVSEAVQQWKEGRNEGYQEAVSLVRLAWSDYVAVLDVELEQAVREGLGQRVWRNVHYPIIELLRRERVEGERKGEGVLASVLEEFTAQYQSLLEGLQSSHGFSLQQILHSGLDPSNSKAHRRMVLLALIPCHWCLVSLGDLCRYQQQLAIPPDWSKPRSYYLKAIQLAPKSGRPYNQLAVVAINAHRRLDAVYYYLRSLFAKSPVDSAHDNLVGLFEEGNRKAVKQDKARERERQKLEREAERRRKREERKEKSKKKRERESGGRHEIVYPSGHKEVWLVPGSDEWREMRMRGRTGGGGGEVSVNNMEERVEEGKGMLGESYLVPEEEVERQLTSTFLIVHGKLYTKIGIDDLERSEVKLVKLWREMVRGELGVQAAHTLVKMIVINICSIHHSLTSSDSESGRSYYFNLAFGVAVLLAKELTDPAVMATADGGDDTDEQGPPRDEGWLERVSGALPAARVWLEWLARQDALWSPLLSQQNRIHLAQFLLHLKASLQSQLTAGDYCYKWAGLWEDGMLMGFMPIKSEVSTETSLATPSLYKLTNEQRRQQNVLRLSLLSEMCDSLSRHTHYDEVGRVSEREGGEEMVTEVESESGDDVMVEGYSEEEERESCEEQNQEEEEEEEEESAIWRLKAQKERLSQQIRQVGQALATTQTVLQEAAAAGGGGGEREMVVCPRYLVPDTNGFVDQLDCIRTLVESGHFVLAVPLVVVSELEGLSKGEAVTVKDKKEGPSGERGKERGRGERVKEGARAAIGYIRQVMSPALQVLTTRGSLLQSLSFTAELTSKATNDDLILESTLSLHRKLSSSGPGHTLYTVVLLTDDRNLRVKAHAAQIPVKDIPHFMSISRLA